MLSRSLPAILFAVAFNFTRAVAVEPFHSVFDVTSYGAKGDGQVNNAGAIPEWGCIPGAEFPPQRAASEPVD
jgi:hypothetical protein